MTLGQLPIGSRVREPKSGMVFIVAAHEHPGYTGTTLFCDRIIRKGCIDAMEPAHQDRWVKELGLSDYRLSNIHQWLNSDKAGWYTKSSPTDEPPTENKIKSGVPYAGDPGFLSAFSEDFKNALVENDIPCVTGSGAEQRAASVKAKAYLLSADEMGLRSFTNIPEGTKMPLFRDFRARIGLKPADPADFNFPMMDINETNQEMAWYYWLRTPHNAKPWYNAYVHCSGMISYLQAANGDLGIRPALQISPEIPVSDQCGDGYIYDILPGGEGK